jgi:hypothetical protein
MVPRRRFERPTCRLGGGCSILLSYRGVLRGDARGGGRHHKPATPPRVYGGAEEDRTPDLRIANATLSQLSYRPKMNAHYIA